jgi:hypothetical protein
MALVIAANQGKAASQEELEHMLSELETLTEEEARRLAAEESTLGR